MTCLWVCSCLYTLSIGILLCTNYSIPNNCLLFIWFFLRNSYMCYFPFTIPGSSSSFMILYSSIAFYMHMHIYNIATYIYICIYMYVCYIYIYMYVCYICVYTFTWHLICIIWNSSIHYIANIYTSVYSFILYTIASMLDR